MLPVRGSVLAVPLADGCADVVVAGEILEHVEDDIAVLAECARLLRPGGTLVIDALADTRIGRFLMVTVAERLVAAGEAGATDRAGRIEAASEEAAGPLGEREQDMMAEDVGVAGGAATAEEAAMRVRDEDDPIGLTDEGGTPG